MAKSLNKFLEELKAGNVLLPYQIKWVVDESRFRIACKGRQTRFSTTIGLEAVIGLSDKTNSLIVSASEKNAQEVLDKCLRWIRAMQDSGVDIKATTESKSEIGLSNGAKIFSLAQNPDTVRGFSGNVYLDEFAHHTNDKAIYEAILPAITAGYKLSIISTPLGESGLFNEIWSNETKYKDYSRHKTDIYQAREQGLPVDIELIKRNFDEQSFRQEYMCEFVDESTSYFPYSLIRSNIGEPIAEGGGLYCGIDIGRKRDLTVIYILRKLGEKFYTVAIEELKNEAFEVQMAAVRNVLTTRRVRRVCVDSTGIGSQLAEELQKEFGYVEPVNFTNEVKESMVVSVKRLLENRNLQIPDNQNLISDIHGIKKTVTSSNNVRFDADRNEAGHSDRFWALALGVQSATVANFSVAFSA